MFTTGLVLPKDFNPKDRWDFEFLIERAADSYFISEDAWYEADEAAYKRARECIHGMSLDLCADPVMHYPNDHYI